MHASYLTAVAEYQAEGGYPDFDGLNLAGPARFCAYVEALCRDPRSAPAPDWPAIIHPSGRVPGPVDEPGLLVRVAKAHSGSRI